MRSDQVDVSVIVVFLNEERFLEEAIQSVYAQTHPHWELVLADDGSTDRSSEIARTHAARNPERVRYLEHPGHSNRGASATRNLGVANARAPWIAFLDGDDIWLPQRLERSIALAERHPEAAMLYAKTLYWHSWQGSAASAKDRIQPHYFPADCIVPAPELLTRHLSDRAAVPCMGSLLLKRAVFLGVGGFDESFRSLVDDAVFLAKILVRHQVFVSNECWDKYRQHAGSDTAQAAAQGRMREAHKSYLRWLETYLKAEGVDDPRLNEALQAALRRSARHPHDWRSRAGRIVRRLGLPWTLS